MSDPVTAEEVCADCGLPFLPREERIQTPKGSEHSYMTCTRRMKAYINQLKVEIADLREDCDRGTSEANKFHALWKAAASDLEKCKADFTANASAYVEDLAELKSATPEPEASRLWAEEYKGFIRASELLEQHGPEAVWELAAQHRTELETPALTKGDSL